MNTMSENTQSPAGIDTDRLRETILQASAHLGASRAEEAIIACEDALKIEPNCAEALLILGLVSFQLDEPSHALPLLKHAQELQPDIWDFTEALASAYARVGNVNEGLFYAKLAVTQSPHPTYPNLVPAEYRNFLANLEEAKPHLYRHRARRLLLERRPSQAIEACQKQLDITPGDPETYRILARASRKTGQIERAVASGHALMHGSTHTSDDLSEIAQALTAGGRFSQAQACHRAARDLAPEDPAIESLQLKDMLQNADTASETLVQAHAEWWQRHAAPLAQDNPPIPSDDDKTRRLRIGYFCSSFSDNELTRLFRSIIEVHDRSKVEVYCYSDGQESDFLSDRITHLADRWTDLVNVDDETAAEILHGDAIDVAVDLTGHGEGNRLLTMVRSTVPVTVNWLNYPHPSGHDYFFANNATLPDQDGQPVLGGHIHHVDGPLAAYVPPATIPDVNESPAAVVGQLTFGIMGDLALINTDVARTIKPLLAGLPGARLVIANKNELDNTCINATYEAFSHLGLRDRVDIVNPVENFTNEYEFYFHIDVALELAHTTNITQTSHALWMGVPVLTIAGKTFASRQAAATLIDANCREWVCKDPADLASTARLMAQDLPALADTRNDLRARVAASPLANARATTAALESAFRQIWQDR